MYRVIVPTIDPGNPLYCPDIPASHFLQSLMKRDSSSQYAKSFAHHLGKSSQDSQNSSITTSNLEDTFKFIPRHSALIPPRHSCCSHVASPVTSSTKVLPKRKVEDSESDGFDPFSRLQKRTRSDLSQPSSFVMSSDPTQAHLPSLLITAPTQESSEGYYQELFKKFSGMPSSDAFRGSPRRVVQLERELYGHPIGPETPEALARLLGDLSRELPGIFLTRRLSDLHNITHQDIVEILGREGLKYLLVINLLHSSLIPGALPGYLARHILEYFRGSLIERLDLSGSLSHEDGLNELKPAVVLEIFALPHSFTQLSSLNLNRVSLEDFDLTRIHHLPSLKTLWLNNTGIGNEGIGHLTTLKFQLEELHIEDNIRIDDDCIPSICLFRFLTILRTWGTNINMPGLRRLSLTVQRQGREIDIEIPQHCDAYLNNLHSQYQLHPSAPLIRDPRACVSLSNNALKANLAAHAAFNPSIYISGSKPELTDRLKAILETRLADCVVKEVAWGYESADEGSGDPHSGEE